MLVTRKRARSTAVLLVDTKASENERRSKTERITDESIDVNRCCAYFEYYADDAGADRMFVWMLAPCRLY